MTANVTRQKQRICFLTPPLMMRSILAVSPSLFIFMTRMIIGFDYKFKGFLENKKGMHQVHAFLSFVQMLIQYSR